MLKRIAFTLVWLVIGLLGTAAIFLAGVFIINTQVPVKIASGGKVYADFWDRGYVSTEGTWTIEGMKQAHPVQTSRTPFATNKRAAVRPPRPRLPPVTG